MPVQRLTQTVDSMRAGNLSSRVSVKGSDDVAVLGEHFNKMADKIQEDMLLIQKEVQAKQDFVDNFAHELKSPMTSIYGFAEYIQKANVSEQEVTECMEFIMDESAKLMKLSYTLLDMAEIREKTIEKRQVKVHTLYDGVQGLMEKKAAESGVSLKFFGGDECITGNEILLQCLLSNLIHNAVCACLQGGIVVVSAQSRQGRLCLTVEDNGCGIPETELKNITEPFYRVDKARNRAEGRTRQKKWW